MKYCRAVLIFVFLAMSTGPLNSAPVASGRYTLILTDPPLAERLSSGLDAKSARAETYRAQIQQAQQNLRRELESRHIAVIGSADYVINALFVEVSPDREEELRHLPGVKAVIPVRRYKLQLNRAVPLVDGPAAWSTPGGVQNAGRK